MKYTNEQINDLAVDHDFTYKRKYNKNRELIYNYIVGFINKNGFAPTHMEIAKALGIKGLATIAFHIGRLVEDKRLDKHLEIARCLVVPSLTSEHYNIKTGEFTEQGVVIGEEFTTYSKEDLVKLINESKNRIKFYRNLQKKLKEQI